MSVVFVKGLEVTRPDILPVTSSILDHATVVENTGSFGLTNNEGLWPSYNCLDTMVPTALCPAPLQDTTKDFVFAEWQPAFDFAMYGGVQCSNVGLDVADAMSEVKRVFKANEGAGVEQALLLNRFVATTSDDPVQWDAPVDLTPSSGPTGLLSAYASLALLEGYAAAHYAGLPTIHMPRAMASLLNERIVWIDGKAFTRSGSKVAIGGGYDASEDDGTWDMFATGEVYVERSEEVDVHEYVIPGTIDLTGSIDSDPNQLTDNSSVFLAERMYRVAVDCLVAKCTAKVW